MPLVEHLYELRNRLAKAGLAISIAIVVAFVFREQVFDFLKHPYCQTDLGAKQGCDLYSFEPLEQFNVTLRISFIAGVVCSSPIWLYQLGAFITPALYKKERRYAAAFFGFSVLFFAAGAVFAYLTLAHALDFLLSFSGDGVTALPSIKSYLSFVTLLLLAFGIAFEFPVILMFLNVVGIMSSERMRKWRRGMIVGIAIASAVITPTTDPYTFCLMAIPLYLLYEVVIVLARIRERSQRRKAQAHPELPDDMPSPMPAAPEGFEALPSTPAPVPPVTTQLPHAEAGRSRQP